MNDYVVSIKDLMITYSDFRLMIEELNLNKGYVYGLIGKNGSGKTTLLDALLDLIPHCEDDVRIFGQRIKDNEVAIKNRIAYVSDDFVFPGNYNLNKVAKDIAPFYERFDEKCFNQLINKFGLSKYTKFKDMSKGSQNKAYIAFALSHGADLIVMDEPTANLDPIARKDILDVLYEIMSEEDKTIIFSTHITSDLDKIADHVILLDQGRIQFNLPKDKLEEECCKVFLEEIDENIRPYLKGIKRHANGYEALCINSTRFMDDDRYQFSRATIEEIMYYWEIKNE